MTTRNSAVGVFATAAAMLGGLTMLGSSALAQPQPGQTIAVTAPRVVERQVGTTTIGTPILVVSLSGTVSYGDLDLTRRADAATLGQRVLDTARSECDRLEAEYPSPAFAEISTNRDCVTGATYQAMAVVNGLIAASNLK